MVVYGVYVMRWTYEDIDITRCWCLIVDGLYVIRCNKDDNDMSFDNNSLLLASQKNSVYGIRQPTYNEMVIWQFLKKMHITTANVHNLMSA